VLRREHAWPRGRHARCTEASQLRQENPAAMRDIRRLLVAIDLHRDGSTLTAGSCIASDHAVDLAKHIGAEVVLFHATGPDRAGARVHGTTAAGDRAQRTLDQVADRFRAIGVAAAIATSDEPPGFAIIRHVLRDRIDLVLAGRRNERSHGRTGLGSVSNQLVRKCPCPVWVARPGSDGAPRRVLAASDLTAVGARVIDYAAFVAAHYRAELHVVHAFQLPIGAQIADRAQIERNTLHEREQRTRQLEEQLERAHGAPASGLHVVRAAPSKAILGLSAWLEPDLVVMGTVSRGGVRGLLIGNTAERLIGGLDCSLLTVKPDDFVCPIAEDA
jgi:universal stress protein E